MAWIQLRQPNLAVKGSLSYCLVYARNVFGVGPAFQTAWSAWLSTQFPHEDKDFPPVAVPIWFRYPATGSLPGHVAVRLPNGQIYSSPYKTRTTHAVLNSIAEVERLYGARYVGWSEDINNVRVAEEADMTKKLTSTDQVRKVYNSFGIDIAGNNPILQKWVDDGGTDYDLMLGLAPQVQANMTALQNQTGTGNPKAEALLKAVKEAVSA